MDRDPIVVIIAEPHTLLREALSDLLKTSAGIRVAAEAADSATAYDAIIRVRPDVVLLDAELSGPSPELIIRQVRDSLPQTEVIVLPMSHGHRSASDLIAAGAADVISRNAHQQDLVDTVRRVGVRDRRSLRRIGQPVPSSRLSGRELEVLTLAACALSNRQIATRLSIKETTVKRHLRNIFHKLGARSRIDAVNRALAAKLFKAPRY